MMNRVSAGQYVSNRGLDRRTWNLSTCEPLGSDELTREILRYKESGDIGACNRVIESHLRLVAKIARRVCGTSVCMDDLMAEGGLALRRALDNFDPGRGANFTGYASVSVEHALRTAARSVSEHVTIPSRERRRAAARYRGEMRFYIENGRWPSSAERTSIAAENAIPGAGSPTGPWRDVVSLDAEHAGGGGGLASGLADGGPSPADRVSRGDEHVRINRAVDALPQALATALRLRFGMGGGQPMSVSEVADVLGMPTQAAERALSDGMRRLRSSLATPAAQSAADGDRPVRRPVSRFVRDSAGTTRVAG